MEKINLQKGQIPLLEADKGILLSNKDYYYYFMDKVESAKERIWGVMFIVNAYPDHDPNGLVKGLLNALSEAVWRGVDVKLVIPKGNEGGQIDFVNQVAINYVRKFGVDCRCLQDQFNYGMHSKYFIFDRDEIVLGSHNWTDNAFGKSNEDSTAVHSKPLNQVLSHQFSKLWNYGKEGITY